MTAVITYQFKGQNILQSIPVSGVYSHVSLTQQYQTCKDYVCKVFHMKEDQIIFTGIRPLEDEVEPHAMATKIDFATEKIKELEDEIVKWQELHSRYSYLDGDDNNFPQCRDLIYHTKH